MTCSCLLRSIHVAHPPSPTNHLHAMQANSGQLLCDQMQSCLLQQLLTSYAHLLLQLPYVCFLCSQAYCMLQNVSCCRLCVLLPVVLQACSGVECVDNPVETTDIECHDVAAEKEVCTSSPEVSCRQVRGHCCCLQQAAQVLHAWRASIATDCGAR